MAPVGHVVHRLLRSATAALLLCAVWWTAPVAAQEGASGSRGGTLPLPPTQAELPPLGPQVVDIQIEGLRAKSREAVLNAMSTRIGHPFDQTSFEKDIRKLTSRTWFVHVVPKKQEVPGGVLITLSVIERPVLEYVHYFGWEKISERVLAKETGLKRNDPFDPYAVREAARKIESLYHSKGFSDASVEIQEGAKTGDRGAIFLIKEGKKLKFGKITFEGNSREIAPDGRLKKIIESRQPILFFIKGEVDRERLKTDEDRLTDYYRSLGFFKAVVGRRLQYNANEDKLDVTFYIHEGPRYNVRNVSFIGNKVFPDEAFTPNLRLPPGKPYDQSAMNRDIGMLKDIYGSNGYVFANAFADLRFDLQPGVVDIIYRMEEGQQYRIGDMNVTIKGDNPHTRASTILNRLDMRPGDIADIRKFRDGERRIKLSGLFNVDPTKGEIPRITISPPESSEELAGSKNGNRQERTAAGRGDGYRGQSPDDYAGQARAASLPQWNNGRPQFSQSTTTHAAAYGPAAASPPSGSYPAQQSTAQPASAAASHAVVNRNGGFLREPGSQPQVRAQSPDPRGSYGGSAVNQVAPYPQPYAANSPVADPYVTPAQYAGPAQDPLAQPSVPRDFGSLPGELPPPGLAPPGNFLSPESLPPMQPSLPVDIVASEAQTGRFMLGAGVNSNAGLVGSIILDEQNFDWRRWPTSWEDFRSGRAFRGAGQKFRIEAAPGTVVQRYLFNFSEPYMFDTPVSFGLSGYYFNRYYRDWMEQRVGGRVTWGYQFNPDFSGSIGLRAEDVFIGEPRIPGVPDIVDVLGHTQLYSVRSSLAHDTRDSAFLPTEGHFVTATFEYFMGTFYYPWFGLNAQQHWLLRERPDGTGRHTFSYYNQLGFTGSNTPVYERFFAGGFSTLRGFQFRGASPQQGSTDPGVTGSAIVGGDFQFLNSLEYMFPITADDMLKMVAFVDFGTVESDIAMSWDQFRIAPGMGVRVTIPAISAAPIAIDFAVPVKHAPGDLIQNISFFVGVGR